jgi:hypothetical protein
MGGFSVREKREMAGEEKWPAAEEKQQAGTHLIASMTRPHMIFLQTRRTRGGPAAVPQ